MPLHRAHPRLEPLAAEGGFDTDREHWEVYRDALGEPSPAARAAFG